MSDVTCKIETLQARDHRVTVGRFTYGNPRLMLWNDDDRIEIGAFCSIADDVTILGGGEHNTHWVTTYPLRVAFGDPLAWKDGHPPVGSAVIGNDVWIGFGATLLSGAVIGDGAVIGARAVVAGKIPPYAVVVGSPASVRRFRFAPPQIEALLQIRWWNWPIERILEFSALLSSPDIDAFIAAARKVRHA
ncbi:CatB-related O-acetyltransferase [Vineibacter terrae]|uniref:CatB-related O-acetyltransferase n=1 Tax=Vineibacter terrae TaxID=2586908 RepID=UPI002E374737|nr:CatB-related O-acetyltransferase [Vineibacter terrae]HEX2886684.1 CatB-related O-acetyltransferase [Vineibacter terrae]